jgi:hypothetical protein
MTKMQNFFKFGHIFSVKLQTNPSWTWQQWFSMTPFEAVPFRRTSEMKAQTLSPNSRSILNYANPTLIVQETALKP